MMAHNRDAYAAGDFPEEEMIGKTPQVDPTAVSRRDVEALWVCSGLLDERVQLFPELVTQLVVDAVASGAEALRLRDAREGSW